VTRRQAQRLRYAGHLTIEQRAYRLRRDVRRRQASTTRGEHDVGAGRYRSADCALDGIDLIRDDLPMHDDGACVLQQDAQQVAGVIWPFAYR
jgi:hypothetical protein